MVCQDSVVILRERGRAVFSREVSGVPPTYVLCPELTSSLYQ